MFLVYKSTAVAMIPVTETTQFSILTCAPGKEIYSLFGHSAIRIQDSNYNFDVVFNYGIFSFETENFYWKFARGYTDYLLGAQLYQDFLKEYKREGRAVVEQVINLPLKEKKHLYNLLMDNYKPENRIYRYNYFTNNCATKIRDIVDDSVDNQIQWSESGQNETYRTLIEPYLEPWPWIKLGIDLLLGVPADYRITNYDKMCLPDHLSEGFNDAKFQNIAIVQPQKILLNGKLQKLSGFTWFDPMLVFGLLLILVYFLTRFEFQNQLSLRFFDFTLYLVLGLAGIIVAFMSLVSVHPTVFPNFHLLWLFPSHIIISIFILLNSKKKWLLRYRQILGYVTLLLLALLMLRIQSYSFSIVPVLGIVLLRSNLPWIRSIYFVNK